MWDLKCTIRNRQVKIEHIDDHIIERWSLLPHCSFYKLSFKLLLIFNLLLLHHVFEFHCYYIMLILIYVYCFLSFCFMSLCCLFCKVVGYATCIR